MKHKRDVIVSQVAKFEKELDVMRFVKMQRIIRLSLKTVLAKQALPNLIHSDSSSSFSGQEFNHMASIQGSEQQL